MRATQRGDCDGGLHDSWLPDDNVVDAYDVDDESDGRMHGASASGL